MDGDCVVVVYNNGIPLSSRNTHMGISKALKHGNFLKNCATAGLVILVNFITACGTVADEHERISVMNPIGYAPAIERKPMAARPADVEGKTVYLVDVTFNNGDVYLQEMQKWFAANMPGVKTEFRSKKGAYFTDDPALWQEIQAAHGLMIMAIGH
ncbi:MAG: Thiol-disulfide oxidoreductase protein [Gammaproteobacteria bacterium]|nr:Thiol-disulfide oxidoreductase protein [Gammaproteobacteria bacterium]